jgi:alpha-glucosidase (family GH31 glycosyl hydrolase)
VFVVRAAFIDKLHSNGQRWVPILEPGVFVGPGYEPYESGMKAEIFMTDYTREVPVLGVLWAGASYFPDFISQKTEDWWGARLEVGLALVSVALLAR